jgi:hypothetical protein
MKIEQALTPTEQFYVFGNVQLLYRFHRDFLVKLENLINSWTDSSVVGPLFLDQEVFFLRLGLPNQFLNILQEYKVYIQNYGNSNISVTYLLKTNPKFQKLFEVKLNSDFTPRILKHNSEKHIL